MTYEAAITSRRNKRVVAAATLRHARERKERGLTLVEGYHLVAEAIKQGVRLQTVFVTSDIPPLPISDVWMDVVEVTEPVMERIADTTNPQGPVAVMEIPTSQPLTPDPTLVLCGVADPGNAGTLIRTAGAFGYNVAITEGSADPWSPKVIRAGSGGHFHTGITLLERDPVDALREAGLSTIALVPRDGVPLGEPPSRPCAILVGNEAHGIEPATAASAQHRVTIGVTRETESLNAAVAGAIALHWYRQL